MFFLGDANKVLQLSLVTGCLFGYITYRISAIKKSLLHDKELKVYLREALVPEKLHSSKNQIFAIATTVEKDGQYLQFKLPQYVSSFNSGIKYTLEVWKGAAKLEASTPVRIQCRKDGKYDCFGNEKSGYVKREKKTYKSSSASTATCPSPQVDVLPQLFNHSMIDLIPQLNATIGSVGGSGDLAGVTTQQLGVSAGIYSQPMMVLFLQMGSPPIALVAPQQQHAMSSLLVNNGSNIIPIQQVAYSQPGGSPTLSSPLPSSANMSLEDHNVLSPHTSPTSPQREQVQAPEPAQLNMTSDELEQMLQEFTDAKNDVAMAANETDDYLNLTPSNTKP